MDDGEIKKITEIFGQNFVSLTEFGLKNSFGKRKVLLVLDEIGVNELGIAKKTSLLKHQHYMMTAEEFEKSQDVFSLFFLELSTEPRVLAGQDLAKKVSVKKEDVRHELERSIRASLIGFRNAFLSTGFFDKKALLSAAAAEIQPVIMGLLFLKNKSASSTKEGLEIVEKSYKIQNSLYRAIYGPKMSDGKKLEAVHGFLQELTEKIDKFG